MKKIITIIGILIFSVSIGAQPKANELLNREQTQFQTISEATVNFPIVTKEAEDLNNQGVARTLNEKNYNAAIILFKQAIESDPRCVQCRYNLGMALIKIEKLDEAIGIFQDLSARKSDYALAYAGLGEAYDSKGLLKESMQACRKAVELAPNDAILLTNLGNALNKLKEYEEALTYLNRALKLNNKMAVIYNNRATVLHAMGRNKEAVEDLKRAVALQPGSAQVHNNLGVILGALGKEKEARVYYAEALRLNPGWNVAIYNLAMSNLASGEHSAARENVFALERVDPQLAEKARKAVFGKFIIDVSGRK